METQQVSFDFPMYSLPMPLDAPVTILAVGHTTLHAAVDLELPLNSAGELVLWHMPLRLLQTASWTPFQVS